MLEPLRAARSVVGMLVAVRGTVGGPAKALGVVPSVRGAGGM
jgi:hypothetical protein